eukprot:2784451-Heterocapsa_arctica.AAC.1
MFRSRDCRAAARAWTTTTSTAIWGGGAMEEKTVSIDYDKMMCGTAMARAEPVASAVSAAGLHPAVLGVADSNSTPPRR